MEGLDFFSLIKIIKFLEPEDIFKLTQVSKFFWNILWQNPCFWTYFCLKELNLIGGTKDKFKSFWNKEFLLLKNKETRIIPFKGIVDCSVGLDLSLFCNLKGQVLLLDEYNNITKLRVPAKIVRVFAGGYHHFLLSNQDEVWTFGNNQCGQLGLGHLVDVNQPTKVSLNFKPKEIAIGEDHTIFLDNLGELWGVGQNCSGQLGIPDRQDKLEITKINMEEKIVMISVGKNHNLALGQSGQIWGFGNNSSRQLGFYHPNILYSPTLVPLIVDCNYISCGSYHSLILDKSGPVLFGLSGLAYQRIKRSENVEKIAAGAFHNLLLDKDGNLFILNLNRQKEIVKLDFPKVAEIFAGRWDSLIILDQ